MPTIAEMLAVKKRQQERSGGTLGALLENPLMAAKFARQKANVSPPMSVMDPRYTAWKQSQDQADTFLMGADLLGAALPLAGPAAKLGIAGAKSLAPKAGQMADGYMARTGLLNYAKPNYQGGHTPPLRNNGAPAHDLTGGGAIYPDDVYSVKGPQYYSHFGGNDPIDRQTFGLLAKIRGAPDAEITIYRAVPKDASASTINSGDWVTVNKAYAKQHGESALNGEYKILEQKVKAKDIFTNGDSIHEWGYDPK